jgi:N6-L-threonylcarbamoyladenine synthase
MTINCYIGAMKILSIETSCDETGISLLEYSDNKITLLGNALASQIEIHEKYGGVFPALAKRAHAEKIIPLTIEALSQANLLILPSSRTVLDEDIASKIYFLDEKEKDLKVHLIDFVEKYQKPDIDSIAVTVGPGLEPALWVGVNTARALGILWNVPVIGIDHMEGHLLTPLMKRLDEKTFEISEIGMPALALLISGGHSELILIEEFGNYKKIGQTRDDAIGEAFDKVARMLGLPYPGGPAISRLAQEFRNSGLDNQFTLPRPMINSGDYDFSFSGIKTAVLYAIRDFAKEFNRELTDLEKQMLACEFEEAVTDVLMKKVRNAVQEYGIQSLIIGGGVASNTYIRKTLQEKIGVNIYLPEPNLATDNAVMIGVAGIFKSLGKDFPSQKDLPLKANGNLSL